MGLPALYQREEGVPSVREVDIQDLDKADVLVALYNAPVRFGRDVLPSIAPMTRADAQALLEESAVFDYLQGRPLKIDLSGVRLKTDQYNSYRVPDAAEMVLDALRARSRSQSPPVAPRGEMLYA